MCNQVKQHGVVAVLVICVFLTLINTVLFSVEFSVTIAGDKTRASSAGGTYVRSDPLLSQQQQQRGGGRTPAYVCIIGNAPDYESALRVHLYWYSFPSYWYLWNDTATADAAATPSMRRTVDSLTVVESPSGRRLTHARGLELVLKEARNDRLCEFFFIHDDDIYWQILANNIDDEKEGDEEDAALVPAEVLKRELLATQPLFAGFVWPYRYPDFSTSIVEPIAPCMATDNGIYLIHHSQVGLLFPIRPRGEGGFRGEWTLPARFLNFFIPRVLRDRCYTFPRFRYSNNISGVVDGRHPYEWRRNKAYDAFLEDGCILPPSCARVNNDSKANVWYHNNHPAVAGLHVDKPISRRQPFTIHVYVFCYNRPYSLKTLLKSLLETHPPSHARVLIHVRLDVGGGEGVENHIRQVIEWFVQKVTYPVDIFESSQNVGLKGNILGAWDPQSNDEYALFLEDDLLVSPFIFQVAENTIQSIVYDVPVLDLSIAAVSMFNMQFSEVSDSLLPFPSNAPFYYQFAQSWGPLYFPRFWRRFKKSLKTKLKYPESHFYLPNSLINRWPVRSSWKKTAIKYMVAEGFKTLFLPIEDGTSLIVFQNASEGGLHDSVSKKEFSDPCFLQYGVRFGAIADNPCYYLPRLPYYASRRPHLYSGNTAPQFELDDLLTYDLWGQENISRDVDVSSFDYCSVVALFHSRPDNLLPFLDHYSKMRLVGQILVIWNNLEVEPEAIDAGSYLKNTNTKVTILEQTKNSLNNRFAYPDLVLYDCVFSVDDDWHIPPKLLYYEVRTWRYFFNQMVGSIIHSRHHERDEASSAWKYADSNKMFSFVLSGGGTVLHKKYLVEYSAPKYAEMRDLVDKMMNCEDILLAFIVGKLSKKGPVVIESWPKPIDEHHHAGRGLSGRFNHYDQRSLCISRFMGFFGEDALKMTETIFYPKKKYGGSVFPGAIHYKDSNSISAEQQQFVRSHCKAVTDGIFDECT